MKKIALAVLLIFSVFAWAGTIPNPAEYTINVHVNKSRTKGAEQTLNVVIDGRKFKLVGGGPSSMLLAVGDYKAKLVKDEHKGAYDSLRAYEFLFPDQKTRKFWVIGQTE